MKKDEENMKNDIASIKDIKDIITSAISEGERYIIYNTTKLNSNIADYLKKDGIQVQEIEGTDYAEFNW